MTVEAPVVSSDDSGDDNDYTEEILIGFLVVVVGLLLILGLKSDIEDFQRKGQNKKVIDVAELDTGPLYFSDDRAEMGLKLEF